MRIESALIPHLEMKEMKASPLTILALGKRGEMCDGYNARNLEFGRSLVIALYRYNAKTNNDYNAF